MYDVTLRAWIAELPCVKERRVVMDVRGPFPVLICGLRAAQVETRDDVINFVIDMQVTEQEQN